MYGVLKQYSFRSKVSAYAEWVYQQCKELIKLVIFSTIIGFVAWPAFYLMYYVTQWGLLTVLFLLGVSCGNHFFGCSSPQNQGSYL